MENELSTAAASSSKWSNFFSFSSKNSGPDISQEEIDQRFLAYRDYLKSIIPKEANAWLDDSFGDSSSETEDEDDFSFSDSEEDEPEEKNKDVEDNDGLADDEAEAADEESHAQKDISSIDFKRMYEFIDLLDKTNSQGKNLCHVAAEFGSSDALDWLHTMNAGLILQADEDGNYPLHIAASYKHADAIRLLMKNLPWEEAVKVVNKRNNEASVDNEKLQEEVTSALDKQRGQGEDAGASEANLEEIMEIKRKYKLIADKANKAGKKPFEFVINSNSLLKLFKPYVINFEHKVKQLRLIEKEKARVDIEKLKTDNLSLKIRVNELEHFKANADKIINQYKGEAVSARKDLEKKLEENKNLEEQLRKLQAKLESQIKESEQSISTLKQRVEGLIAEKGGVEALKKEKEVQFDKLNASLRELQTKAMSADSSKVTTETAKAVAEEVLSGLRDDLAKSQKKVESLSAERNALAIEKATLNSKLESDAQLIKGLESEKEKLAKQLVSQDRELSDAKNMLSETKSRLELKTLEAQEASSRYEEQEQRLEEVKRELSQVDVHKKSEEELKSRLREVRLQAKEKVEVLEQRLENTGAALQVLQDEKRRIDQKNREAMEDIDSLNDELTEKNESITRLESQIEVKDRLLTEAKNANTNAVSTIRGIQDEKNRLILELEQAASKRDEYYEENAQLKQFQEQAEERHSHDEQDRNRVERQLAEKVKELGVVKSALAEKEKTISRREEEIVKFRDKQEENVELIEDLSNGKTKLEAENEKCIAQLRTLEKQVKDLNLTVQRAEAQKSTESETKQAYDIIINKMKSELETEREAKTVLQKEKETLQKEAEEYSDEKKKIIKSLKKARAERDTLKEEKEDLETSIKNKEGENKEIIEESTQRSEELKALSVRNKKLVLEAAEREKKIEEWKGKFDSVSVKNSALVKQHESDERVRAEAEQLRQKVQEKDRALEELRGKYSTLDKEHAKLSAKWDKVKLHQSERDRLRRELEATEGELKHARDLLDDDWNALENEKSIAENPRKIYVGALPRVVVDDAILHAKTGNCRDILPYLDMSLVNRIFDSEGRSLLHHAVINLQKDMVFLLVKYGADLKYKDKHSTAVEYLQNPSSLKGHKSLGKENRRQAISDITAIFSSPTNHPFITAVANQKKSDAIKQLENYPHINARDKHGKTALHMAAENLDEGLLSLIIKKGAKIDLINKKGDTALHVAVDKAKSTHEPTAAKNVITMLTDAGASAHATSVGRLADKNTPLTMTTVAEHKTILSKTHISVKIVRDRILEQIDLDRAYQWLSGSDKQSNYSTLYERYSPLYDGFNPIMRANSFHYDNKQMESDPDVVSKLLESANTDIKVSNVNSVLKQYYLKIFCREIQKRIDRAQSIVYFNPGESDTERVTRYQQAVRTLFFELVKNSDNERINYLLKSGKKHLPDNLATCVSSDGKSVLDYAIRYSNNDVYQYLVKLNPILTRQLKDLFNLAIENNNPLAAFRIACLLEDQKKIKQAVKIQDPQGDYAIHLSIRTGDFESFCKLISTFNKNKKYEILLKQENAGKLKANHLLADLTEIKEFFPLLVNIDDRVLEQFNEKMQELVPDTGIFKSKSSKSALFSPRGGDSSAASPSMARVARQGAGSRAGGRSRAVTTDSLRLKSMEQSGVGTSEEGQDSPRRLHTAR